MIDLHCHILPGLDDGARNEEEALAMAETAVKDGITTIVATPHVLDQGYRGARERIAAQVEDFNGKLRAAGIPLLILPGAEVMAAPEVPGYFRAGDLPTLDAAGRYLLLELPFQESPWYLERILFELRVAGVTPVLAHPERYRYLRQSPNLLIPYINNGLLTQINAGSLLGYFGEEVRRAAEIMVTHGMAHLVASDAHRPRGARKPVLSSCRRELTVLAGEEVAKRLLEENPAGVIAGETLQVEEPREYRPAKKGFRRLVAWVSGKNC